MLKMVLDKNTFESLFYQYGPRLSSYANKFLSDRGAVEELIQDVYVRFWERYHGKSSESWVPVLFTMVKNRCLDYLRKASYKNAMHAPSVQMSQAEEMLFLQDLCSDNMADKPLLLKELDAEIESLMSELSPKCRDVFRLSRLEGLKYSEIAVQLNISEKTVEKHISTALKLFRTHFSEMKESKSNPELLSLLLLIFFI